MIATTFGWLVILCPLVGCVLIALLWRVLPGRTAGWIGTLAILLSFGAAVGALYSIQHDPASHRQLTSTLWTYAATDGVVIHMNILVDPLSVYMALIISGVSTLIHLYSVSYLTSDKGFRRYFSYLNYFVFSMVLLVLAGNFVLLIVGWAFVGAASYLLISFWYRRTTATRAGIKAFVINVLGDVGMVIGTYFIFTHTGVLDLLPALHKVPHVFGHHQGALIAGGVLFLIGAFAKSAQVPLHTWLPDAMEGPTPVSALIHAATMVTAGVYLIARLHPIYEQAPAAADVGAAVGTATLFIAATIALTVTDIKRVIAYSTMSQIGYMIMGVSTGAYAAGMFHLMTHAFFKALLFMGAGSIIGAMAGQQSLDRMGGFRRALPFTYACFIVGGLALSGLPPFSGFWSKDEILSVQAALGGWHWVLYGFGYLAALFTAIYTFRMIFRAFHNEPVPEAVELEHGHLAHAEQPTNPATGEVEDTDVGFPGEAHVIAEREWPMKVAMGLLALLAFGAGAIQIPQVTNIVTSFLAPTFAGSKPFTVEASNGIVIFGLLLGTGIALLGIGIAYWVWVGRPQIAVGARERFAAVHRLLVNKWYFDELIDYLVVRPAGAFGRFGQTQFERLFVDGTLVGGTTGAVRLSGVVVRAVQSGLVRVYASLLVLGLFAVALYFLVQST